MITAFAPSRVVLRHSVGALSDRAGTSYAKLLTEEITGPLRLRDTIESLSAQQRLRLIQGYTAEHRRIRAWDFEALAGAGAIRSTADDMLTYLQANLHPERLQATSAATAAARTLPGALRLSHELRADAGPLLRIGFAWLYNPRTGDYWHNGATGGYSSYVFFNPQVDYAGVVLMNMGVSPEEEFMDLLGLHISQRFAGKPAIVLSK